MKNVPVAVWILVGVVFCAVLASLVILTSEGRPTDALVSFLTDKMITAIAAVVGLLNMVRLKRVESQTNGTTSQLTQINAQQSHALANSVPVDVVAPVIAAIPPQAIPPHTTGGPDVS